MKKIYKNRVAIVLCLILFFWILFSFLEIGLKDDIKEYDAITVFFYTIAHSSFSLIQMIAPLFVMTLSTYKIHKEFHSGFIKYKLLRMDYKGYIKEKMVSLIKSTWILPTAALFLFTLCYILTKNFNFSKAIPQIIGYTSSGVPMYNGTISVITEGFYAIPLQLMLTYFVVLFLHSIVYANLAFIVCKNNKNFLVTLLESFLIYFAISIISELGLGTIAFKLLHLKFLSGVFNIVGIWIYCDYDNLWGVLIYSIILAVGSSIVAKITYRNKEKVLMACEK